MILTVAEGLNNFFDRVVDVARIKHGNRQTIDTLISEEALLFAKYLREELSAWTPRSPQINPTAKFINVFSGA